MRKLAVLFFLTVLSIGAYAQQNRGRMSDLSDNYGASDNEWLIPLIILLLIGCLFLSAWIKGQNKK